MKNRIKKLSAILLACLLTLSLVGPVFAEGEPTTSGSCGKDGDKLTWTYDTESCVMTISGEGAMEDYVLSMMAPWKLYTKMIREVRVEEGVTALGSGCFNFCTALEKVTLPETLTCVGPRAFMNDTALKEVICPTVWRRFMRTHFAAAPWRER